MPNQQNGLTLDELHITVAYNGYAVDTPGSDEEPPGLHVFETFQALTTWLFQNLDKPRVSSKTH